MTFATEAAFETALIAALKTKGWESEVLKHPTEAKCSKSLSKSAN
jgi:hypothetical protein